MSTLDAEARATAVAAIRELGEQQRLYYYQDPEYRQLDAQIDAQLKIYADSLPAVVMGVCPFCREPLIRRFDSAGLDGPWWLQERPEQIRDPKPCPHFQVLLGAFRLRERRKPKEAGEDLITPGPDVPFVVPELLALPHMKVSIGELALETGDRAFPIAYFSDERISKGDLHSEWCRSTELRFPGGWRICNEEWDFDVGSVFASGLGSWWREEGDRIEVSSEAAECPFIGLPGKKRPQLIADGVREWGQLPTGELVVPFETDGDDAATPALTAEDLAILEGDDDFDDDDRGDLDVDDDELLESLLAQSARPVSDGRQIISIPYRPEVVCGISKDMIACGGEGAVQILALPSGELTTEVELTGVQSLAVDPARRHLAAGSYGTLSFVDIATGGIEWQVEDFYYYVWAIAFRPDGSECAAGGDDKKLRRFALDGRVLGSFEGHNAAVRSASYHPGGALVATGSADKSIRIWEVDSGKEIALLRGHTGTVTRVAFDSSGDVLVSTGDDGHAFAWDWEGGKRLCSLYRGNHVIFSLAMVPHSSIAVVGFGDDENSAQVWDWRANQVLQQIPGIGVALSVVSDGRLVAGGAWSSELVVAPLVTRAVLA